MTEHGRQVVTRAGEEVVDAEHLVAAREQALAKMGAQESRSAGHQRSLARQIAHGACLAIDARTNGASSRFDPRPRGWGRRAADPRDMVRATCHHRGMPAPGEVRIEPLVPSRREDYLRFFDHERGAAFAANPQWAACYCHFHNVSPVIDFDALDAHANRLAMDARIACGEMGGYLAYRGDAVVGWLNAQPRTRLRHCAARLRVPPPYLPVPEHA